MCVSVCYHLISETAIFYYLDKLQIARIVCKDTKKLQDFNVKTLQYICKYSMAVLLALCFAILNF